MLDVARAAGVSRQTVSNVLNTPEIVKAGTRERVQAVIAELGYRPNISARRLRTRQSSTIGFCLDPLSQGISSAVLDRYLHALTEQATARGMRILVYTAKDSGQEIGQFQRLLDEADVDAFVLTSTHDGDPRPGWLRQHGADFVTFGRPWGEADIDGSPQLWVDVDGAAGSAAACRHLLAQGARQIAFLGWPSPSGVGEDRLNGWRSVMLEQRNQGELGGLRWQCKDEVADAQRLVAQQLRRLDGPGELDGIVCASDTLALGALMALNAANLTSIPVIGFDNSPVSMALGISSIDQCLQDVAEGTLELLLGPEGNQVLKHQSNASRAHRLITPQLIVRTRSGV